MKPSPKKPQRRFSGVHREDPASDKRGWCEGANSQDNIQRQISLLMCWNTIRLQKSMKQSSNIDLGVTREQLEGYYREIVCKWGEISEWAFIFYGSSLHVRVLTVIFINPIPRTDKYTSSVCWKSQIRVRVVMRWPCNSGKCFAEQRHTNINTCM